jgi:hypothetical protein
VFEVAGDDVSNLGWIDQFLEFFGFGSPPIRDLIERSVRFNRIWMDVDQVKDIIRSQANDDSRLGLDDKTITDAVKHTYNESRGEAFSRHFSFTVTVVPATVHTNLSQPGSSVDKPAIQPQVQNLMAGGQAAWVIRSPRPSCSPSRSSRRSAVQRSAATRSRAWPSR